MKARGLKLMGLLAWVALARWGAALEVCAENNRYLADGDVPVVLFGSGFWTIIPDTTVDIEEHNAWYARWGANANRASLFAFCTAVEEGKGLVPWMRTGPGQANDGQPKFDLNQPNPAFWKRLDEYLRSCRRHGIYVWLQIFDEPFTEEGRGRWYLNPFNPDNNINELPGLPRGGKSGEDAFYDPHNAPLMAIQDALVRRLLDATAEFDHVVYEIGNEINMDSVAPHAAEWQQHWIRLFETYQHEHGKKLLLSNNTRRSLFEEDQAGFQVVNHHGFTTLRVRDSKPVALAQLVQQFVLGDYAAYQRPIINSRPASDPDRVNYPDVVSEDEGRVLYWSYFLSGGHIVGFRTTKESWKDGEAAERILLHLRAFIAETPFVSMAPHTNLIEGNGLCLANPGQTYAVYLPAGGAVRLDLRDIRTPFTMRGYDPRTGDWQKARKVVAGEWVPLEAPGDKDWAALLTADAS